MSSLKFGTSGLRGLAVDLVGIESRRYAAAFVAHLRERGKVRQVLVGRDLRDSSPAIAASVISAVNGSDVEAIDCGALPTPALALEALRRGVPAIMVTGSHIPADRNGLKFYRADGEIDKADENGILAQLGPVPEGSSEGTPDPRALRRYISRYANMPGRHLKDGPRIGVWQHSSVARDVLTEILAEFGTVIVLGRSETFVAVDTEAVSADVRAQLAAWVREHDLNLIVSTDGDGDRPLVMDETGELVRGDVLGILTARFLEADAVVTPVTSNSSIEGMGAFKEVMRTRVGSPYVIEGLGRTTGTVVGFEANGGVLLGRDARFRGTYLEALPTRDAVLPILALLGAASAANCWVSELVATLPPRVARSDRLEHVAPEKSALLLAELKSNAAGFFETQGAVKSVSDIDGLRFELTSGDVIHYRPSGNAPELRCYTEAATAERADALLAWGLEAATAVVR